MYIYINIYNITGELRMRLYFIGFQREVRRGGGESTLFNVKIKALTASCYSFMLP